MMDELAIELMKKNVDVTLLEPVLEEYKNKEGVLITILQKAQAIFGYLPMELLHYIALKTNTKPAKVLGVATFYTQFRLKPVGKHIISLCQGTACHVNGSVAIGNALLEELQVAEGETTKDGLFTLCNVACLGCCSLSPVMMVGEDTYGQLTPKEAVAIIQNIRKKEGLATPKSGQALEQEGLK